MKEGLKISLTFLSLDFLICKMGIEAPGSAVVKTKSLQQML